MKLIFFILSISLLVYFYSPKPNTEISEPQEFFEKPCENTLSLECIKKFVQENIEYPSDKKDYWSLSEDLTRAGLYEEALDVISKSDNSLNYITLKKIPVYQITKQANLYPEKVADFSPIDALTDPNTEIGKLIPVTSYPTIKIRAYESLAFTLTGHIGEAGQIDYVRYLEQAANEQFKSNATWNALLKRWEAEIEKNEEPMRSNDLMRIAERLIDIGEIEFAQLYLDKIKELSSSRKNNQSRALAEIGDYDAAIEVVKDERVKYAYYEASFAIVDRHIKSGDREAALEFLEQIEKELLENKRRSGKLENLIKVIGYYSKLAESLKAEKLADWIYDKIKSKEFSSLPYEKIPAAYRAAGELEKARKIMQDDVIIRYTKSCSSVSDEENGQYAEEMARLGMIEGYQGVIERICSPAQKGEAWIAVYKALTETEYPLPDINSLISTLPEYLHASFYNSLAAFHFKKGDKEKGNEFLDKAYKSAEMARSTGTLCHTAMIAHFSSRHDLLGGLLEKSIIVANTIKTELPKYYNSSLLNVYFGADKKEDNPRPQYRRFREYLNIASCYNLINLDALK